MAVLISRSGIALLPYATLFDVIEIYSLSVLFEFRCFGVSVFRCFGVLPLWHGT